MPKKKIVAYIPVHIEYEEEKHKKYLISELAQMEFGRYSRYYSSQKKKCRIKDIKITTIKQ